MLARFCCLLTLSLAMVLAQPAIPDTPAGRVFGAWLDAFNSGDQERIAAFYQRYQPQQAVEGMISFRATTGGFDVLSIENSEPRHLDVRVKERNRGMTAIGRMTLKASDPPLIERFSLLGVPPGVTMADFKINVRPERASSMARSRC